MPAHALAVLASCLALGVTVRAAESLSHCPEDTKPARTVNPLTPWVCVLTDERYSTGIECPSGFKAVTTGNKYDPFKCAVEGLRLTPPRGVCPPGEQPVPSSDPQVEYACEKVGKGFTTGPSCPKNTYPVPTPGALQPYKCVHRLRSADPEPVAKPSSRRSRRRRTRGLGEPKGAAPGPAGCPKGTRSVRTENPFNPFQCVPEGSGSGARLRYKKYAIPGEVSFERPGRWDLRNAWKDAEPAVYLMFDTQRDGMPVSLSLTRHVKGTQDFVPMETRMWREEDWHAAKKTGESTVGGLAAVQMEVAKQSAMTFLPLGRGDYYVIAYSAPEDLYDLYLPAYWRMLKTLKFQYADDPKP